MKKILFVYYSQTGQTAAAMAPFIAALQGVHQVEVCPLRADQFTFPWKFDEFFAIFPTCILQQEVAFTAPLCTEQKYDLIVLGWPVWFLSPAPAISSFLRGARGEILRDTPVLSIVTGRNMWFSASCALKKLIMARGGRLVGGIALCDSAPAWSTFITTPRWLLTGRRERFLCFPAAGIKPDTFQSLDKHAKKLAYLLASEDFSLGLGQAFGSFDLMQPEAVGPLLLEAVGIRYFTFWANLIKRLGQAHKGCESWLIVLFRSMLAPTILLLFVVTQLLGLLFPGKVRMMASRLREQLTRHF